MKVRLFTVLAVFAVLVVLASQMPTTAALAAPAREFTYTARVQSMPTNGMLGTWKIGGRLVHVTAATTIDQNDGAARKGARVQVEGFKQKDGSINATSISVIASNPSGR